MSSGAAAFGRVAEWHTAGVSAKPLACLHQYLASKPYYWRGMAE